MKPEPLKGKERRMKNKLRIDARNALLLLMGIDPTWDAGMMSWQRNLHAERMFHRECDSKYCLAKKTIDLIEALKGDDKTERHKNISKKITEEKDEVI